MKWLLVPLMLLAASLLMAFAWLAHIRFRKSRYLVALGASWLLVLPEYVLNITATRWGIDTYSGGEMAAMHLSAGVVCVALALSIRSPISWIHGQVREMPLTDTLDPEDQHLAGR